MKLVLQVVVLFILAKNRLAQHYQIQTDEVFIVQLSPSYFNISDEEPLGEYIYSAAVHGLPDLPKWLSVLYKSDVKLGFLYGTPTQNVEQIKLDLIASNTLTYETSSKELLLEIFSKEDPATKQIKMKIHNLNVEDLMDENTQTRLLDIFRKTLWPESMSDLHFIEIYSALTVGGRRPARKRDGEGVILTIGSKAEFSEVLRELEREVSPLWSLRHCPRDFKKTSSERYFRTKGFLVDWCSFRLVPQNTLLQVLSSATPPNAESKTEHVIQNSNQILLEAVNMDIWTAPTKWEIPRRSYTEEGVVAIFIPLMVLLILAALLTAILGVHPEGGETEEGELYEAVFEELPFFKPKQETVVTQVQQDVVTAAHAKNVRARESTTPSLGRGKRNPLYNSMVDSVTRGSSPFLMSTGSTPSPTPISTLTRSAYPTLRSTLGPSERASTLGRPEPPPYCGTLSK